MCSQELSTVCEKLVNFEITPEDLLDGDVHKIDSTTPDVPPVKHPKLKKGKLAMVANPLGSKVKKHKLHK